MTTNNLLVELQVEELPPKALKKLGECFANTLAASLTALGLASNEARVTAFASPRRLAVHIPCVAERAADKSIAQKLMPVKVGLDAYGQPTQALIKKLAGLGMNAVPELKRTMDGKTETLYFDNVVTGVLLADGLQQALQDTLAKLPIPKVMTYQRDDGWSSVQFVRPAHGLVALHGEKIVPIAILGLTSGRKTHGHRFEATKDELKINDADSYENQLVEEGAVIPRFEKRREEIMRQLDAAAEKEGLIYINDDALLDEVTALVERPNVLMGTFDESFLEVPQECLILTMKANQKYFPLMSVTDSPIPRSGYLTNKFLIVSNITPADASLVIGGNERVVRPRLADARFFYDQDRKKPLDARVMGLSRVVYHNRLGSQGERVERVQAIARSIGQLLGGEELTRKSDQAALLAKADLLTDMVGEFPELQGIMGRYYAQHDGIPDDVAYAIEDHYKPRFAKDELPRNQVGVCVALADKLETLVGMFGIGQIPTGDKDPFALRRHALGVIRMLIEKELPLALNELISTAFSAFPQGLLKDEHALVESFIFERLDGMMRIEYDYSASEVDAVLSLQPQFLCEVPHRLIAVRVFASLPEAAALAAANKRVGNILKKSECYACEIDTTLLQEPAEQALHLALSVIAPKAEAAFATGDYTASLRELAALRAPVDTFFDNVMVNVEDNNLRTNRLALLAELHHAMNRVADISRLA